MTGQNSSRDKMGKLMRAYFMRGLFVVIPVAVTAWLLEYAVSLTNSWLGPFVKLIAQTCLPASITSQSWFADIDAILSFLLLVIFLIVLGVVASYRTGKEGLRLIDHIFIHIPGINSIYRAIRKMVDAFGNSDAQSFKRCVYLYFPHQFPSLGFVTKEVLEEETNRRLLVVFIPHGPSPTSGFVQIVPEDSTWDAGISPEDGFKMIMSVGVLTPDKLPRAKPRN